MLEKFSIRLEKPRTMLDAIVGFARLVNTCVSWKRISYS
jgi:hypothetical protein